METGLDWTGWVMGLRAASGLGDCRWDGYAGCYEEYRYRYRYRKYIISYDTTEMS